MTSAPEITDSESLRAWLRSFPTGTPEHEAESRRIAASLAHRAAMRVLPVVASKPVRISAGRNRWTHLFVMRALLVSGAGTARTNPVLDPAAHSAAAATFGDAASFGAAVSDGPFEAFDPADAVYAAARAVASVEHRPLSATFGDVVQAASCAASAAGSGQRDAVRAALVADALATGAGTALHLRPLWPDGANPLAQEWKSAAKALTEAGPEWAFWIDWYEKCLAGARQDWEGLLTDIALLPSEDWDKGPKHIAGRIARLRRDRQPRDMKTEPELSLPNPPLKLSEVQRAHIGMVIGTPEPSAQNARQLQRLFADMRTQYLQQMGLPNEDPPELEPFTLLSETFGSIADLLSQNAEQERLIRELNDQIQQLERANPQLTVVVQSRHAPMLRGALEAALGTLMASAFIASYGQLGGPSVVDGLNALWSLVRPQPPLPPSPLPLPPIYET